MDFLLPVIGTITGIESVLWKDIIISALKVFLFCLPFIALSFLIEKDVYSVPVINRIIKSVLVAVFVTPVILLGVLNYFAMDLPDVFWEKYPIMENFWIMEGKATPVVLMVLATLYLLTYIVETMSGDLNN